jgi:hypothetical protein
MKNLKMFLDFVDIVVVGVRVDIRIDLSNQLNWPN